MVTYLILCPLMFLAGFIDAIAGGGGLISLPAYMIVGLPVHNAIATNKLSSSMGTTVATTKYALRGMIPWKQVPFYVACAFIGSSIGANLALMINEYYFKILMLVIVPLTLVYVLKKKNFDVTKEPFSKRKTILLCMASAFVVGIYDGFYGPGTGTFLLLLLTAVARIDLRQANGITKCINLTTNIAALVVFVSNSVVIVKMGLSCGCFNILGNYIGATSFTKKDATFVKPVMVTVLAIFIIKLLYELFIQA